MFSKTLSKSIIRLTAFVGITLMLGCTAVPEAIQVADENLLISYRQANENPTANKAKPARWGGVIAKVENLPEATMLEILHYPLRSYGRPLPGDESMGRFRVYVDGFLDPMVFETGRSVTFSGELIGVEEGAVGKHRYVFPTLQSKGYHLWQEIERVEISTIHMWPYYDPWGWRYGPYYQRVIIRRSGHHNNSSGSNNSANRNSSGNSGASATNGSSSTSSRASAASRARAPTISRRASSGNTTGTAKDY